MQEIASGKMMSPATENTPLKPASSLTWSRARVMAVMVACIFGLALILAVAIYYVLRRAGPLSLSSEMLLRCGAPTDEIFNAQCTERALQT